MFYAALTLCLQVNGVCSTAILTPDHNVFWPTEEACQEAFPKDVRRQLVQQMWSDLGGPDGATIVYRSWVACFDVNEKPMPTDLEDSPSKAQTTDI